MESSLGGLTAFSHNNLRDLESNVSLLESTRSTHRHHSYTDIEGGQEPRVNIVATHSIASWYWWRILALSLGCICSFNSSQGTLLHMRTITATWSPGKRLWATLKMGVAALDRCAEGGWWRLSSHFAGSTPSACQVPYHILADSAVILVLVHVWPCTTAVQSLVIAFKSLYKIVAARFPTIWLSRSLALQCSS